MTIKNILVSFNGGAPAVSALEMAINLAERTGAHLTGVLTHGLPNMLYAYGGHIPQGAMDQLEEADKLHRDEVCKTFMDMTSAQPADHIHFLDIYGEADEMLMETALGYDLVVMGPPEKSPNFPHMEAHADVVARNSGKPVLVVPKGYDATRFNGNVLLAWDGKRAASRAMSDVVKLLDASAKIVVLCIGEKKAAAKKAQPVITHLERHGFETELLCEKARKIAKTILATAKERDVGILAMGAYEHAKLAEDLFGGVTNTVLKKAKVPVLLSH
ncbi:MAG: hypothetical protein GQ535_12060 [Rhodobacteraceae bacterium]|nr:hypothetical protein [Paracoccaceae bacterium]